MVERSADRPVHVSDAIRRPLRSTKIPTSVVAQVGDLIPDEEAVAVGEAAAEDLLLVITGAVANARGSPSLLDSSIEALASVSDRLAVETLERVISAVASTLDRPVGTMVRTDDGYFKLLCEAASRDDLAIALRLPWAQLAARASVVMPHAKGNAERVMHVLEDVAQLTLPLKKSCFQK